MGCDIKITGTAIKMPVSKEDGTGELLIKNVMSGAVPKGLKSLGDSLYRVQVGIKAWKKIKDKITEDTFYIVTGEPKAAVSSKGVPFINIVAFQVEIMPEDPKAAKKEEVKPVNVEPKKVDEKKVEKVKIPEKPKKENKPKKDFVAWFSNEKVQNVLIDIDVSLVDLVEKTHLQPFTGQLLSQKSDLAPIAIVPTENGRYKLIAGLKAYIAASMFKKSIKAFVYDKTLEEFNKEFNIFNDNNKKK